MFRRRVTEKDIGWLVFALVFIFSLVISAYKVNSFDLPWHYKTGEWIVKNGRVPSVDFFNFTRQGMEWIDAQWLYQVLVYGVYRAAGPPGFTLLMMALVGGSLLLLAFSVPGRVPMSVRAVAGLLFALGIDSRIMCRPELLSCFLMAVMFFSLERASKGRSRYLVLALVTQALWVNCEGLWPIGLAMIVVYLADHAIETLRAGRPAGRPLFNRELSILLILSVLAGFLQPYGLRGFLFPLELLEEVAIGATLQKQTIIEIQSVFSYPPILRAVKFFFPLIGCSVAAVLFTGRKMRPFIFLFGLLFIYLGLFARRNVSVASIALMQVMMAHLYILAERQPGIILSRAVGRSSAAIAGLVAPALIVLTLIQPVRTWDRTSREPGLGLSMTYYPIGASAFLKSIKYRGNIINNVRLGGFLYYSGWPDWMVMADSRMEIKGEESLALWRKALREHETFREISEKYNADAVVIDLWEEVFVQMFGRLIEDRDWALVYIDTAHNTVVFLKRTPKWEKVIAEKEINIQPGQPTAGP